MPSIEVPLIRPTAHTASGISLCFAADVIRSAPSRLRSAIVPLRPSTPAPVTKQSNRVNVVGRGGAAPRFVLGEGRSEEHTSELQSLMRISYAVFCLNKKKKSIHM